MYVQNRCERDAERLWGHTMTRILNRAEEISVDENLGDGISTEYDRFG